MKVHAYRVASLEDSAPLRSVVEMIDRDGLRDRIRLIYGNDLRVDAIERRGQVWLMDFVKVRTDHGPGKFSPDEEVSGFDFEDEEGFGEETAALYIPATDHMLVQYNHNGVRANRVADYLSDYDQSANNIYSLNPKYDLDVQRKFQDQEITRRLLFTIDLDEMTAADKRAGRSVLNAINLGDSIGGAKVKIEISAKVNGALDQGARRVADSLLSIFNRNPKAIQALKVAGKEEIDDIVEVLDLLQERLSLEYNIQPGEDLRFPREDRWNALLQAKRAWRSELTN